MRGHSPDSPPISTIRHWAGEIFATGARFAAFLRRPTLAEAGQSEAPLRETICLFVVVSLLMVWVAVALLPLAILGSVMPSQQLDQVMSAPPLDVILTVVLLGPLIEELAFRSWLGGTWRYLIAGGLFVAILFGGRAVMSAAGFEASAAAGYGLLTGALIAFVGAFALVRSTRIPTFFARFFPAIFWLNVLAFGALHVFNFTGNLGPALIAFTLPQMLAGAIFAYARIRIGLIAAIGLHMAFNAVPVTGSIVGSAMP